LADNLIIIFNNTRDKVSVAQAKTRFYKDLIKQQPSVFIWQQLIVITLHTLLANSQNQQTTQP